MREQNSQDNSLYNNLLSMAFSQESKAAVVPSYYRSELAKKSSPTQGIMDLGALPLKELFEPIIVDEIHHPIGPLPELERFEYTGIQEVVIPIKHEFQIASPPAHELRTYRSNEVPFAATERALAASFVQGVSRLSVEDVAVTMPDRKIPRSIGKFSFVPLTAKHPLQRSATSAGSYLSVPEGIRTSYSTTGVSSNPYLDTQFAIGLAKENWLVALAAAGIDDEGRLQIKQIQDVSGTNTKKQGENADPKLRLRTGLHDGIDWRSTLVQGWQKFAENQSIGDTLVIQSGKNNRWYDVKRFTYHPGYDGVAERLGFVQDVNGNWVKPITTALSEVAQRASRVEE